MYVSRAPPGVRASPISSTAFGMMCHEPARPKEAQTTEDFYKMSKRKIQSSHTFLWHKSLSLYQVEQWSRKVWKKSSQEKLTVELVVNMPKSPWKTAGNVALPKHVTCVTLAGQSVFVSSLSCTVPRAVVMAAFPLKAMAPPCISAGASHHPLLLLPAVGQAALHCLQFTLLCIPTFSLTSCLDVLTLQNSFSQHTPSPAAHQCRKNPLHSPSYSGVANGDKNEWD